MFFMISRTAWILQVNLISKILEGQLLFNKIDVTDSLTHKHLAFTTISPLFVNRFGRSLQFCHQKFYPKAISDGCRSVNPVSVEGF